MRRSLRAVHLEHGADPAPIRALLDELGLGHVEVKHVPPNRLDF